MFEIYNLVSMIQSDRPELGSIQERIESISSDFSKNFNNTFITGNGLRRDEHVYQDRQVVDAYTRAGYRLESNDEDEIDSHAVIKLAGWGAKGLVVHPLAVCVSNPGPQINATFNVRATTTFGGTCMHWRTGLATSNDALPCRGYLPRWIH
jgi:hypothetical protein